MTTAGTMNIKGNQYISGGIAIPFTGKKIVQFLKYGIAGADYFSTTYYCLLTLLFTIYLNIVRNCSNSCTSDISVFNSSVILVHEWITVV